MIKHAALQSPAHRLRLARSGDRAAILAEYDAELVVAPERDMATLIASGPRRRRDHDQLGRRAGRADRRRANCRIIARLGIGLDNIDVRHATERGIPVTNVPDYCLIEVAEHTLALLLALARKIGMLSRQRPRRPLRSRGRLPAAADRRPDAGHRRPGPDRPPRRGESAGARPQSARHQPLAPRAPSRTSRGLDLERRCLRRAISSRSTCRSPPKRGNMIGAAAARTDEADGLSDQHGARRTGRSCRAGRGAQQTTPSPARRSTCRIASRRDLSQPPYNDPRVIVTPHAAFYSEESVAELRRRVAHQVGSAAHRRPAGKRGQSRCPRTLGLPIRRLRTGHFSDQLNPKNRQARKPGLLAKTPRSGHPSGLQPARSTEPATAIAALLTAPGPQPIYRWEYPAIFAAGGLCAQSPRRADFARGAFRWPRLLPLS